MDKTHDSNLKSWIKVDENSGFPIQNIPFGVCSPKEGGDLHVVCWSGLYSLNSRTEKVQKLLEENQ